MAITLSSTKIPINLIGDSAFPLMPISMKPYPNTDQLTEAEKFLNYRLAVARRDTDNAFGRLKGHFRLLQQMDSRLEITSDIIPCCAILHNFCEIMGDYFNPTWFYRSKSKDAHTSVIGANNSTKKILEKV